ncbi:hypothetical protein [Arthrobacter agilis]|uniref:hypothetical protein n=1 Tax=Arthrobacter agilis TaxID=37921 RepID=UPI0027849C7C|nr:hypothetical protein [Arthrobacter agilis]MDQ0734705.1 hypothetical protein [Arthrobacter agilis]
MSEEDVHRLAVAAADKELAAFELDHAEFNLKEAVVVALEHGTPPEVIAQIADLEPEEVLDLIGRAEEPALLTLDEVIPGAVAAEPAAPIARDLR